MQSGLQVMSFVSDTMKFSEAIILRRSCRTYNGLRLDRLNVDRIETAISGLSPLFPDVDRPVIRLVDTDNAPRSLGTYGFISGARQFLAMAVGDSVVRKVQAGFMFEELILAVTGMGLATCWLGGTFRRGPFSDAMGMSLGDRQVMIVSPVGHPTPKARLAERLIRRVENADHRRPFNSLFNGVREDTSLGKVLQAVRRAPSSTNSQPWRANVQTGSDGRQVVEFSCVTDNQFSSFDMGIAYSHFMLASAEENLRWTVDPASSPFGLRFIAG